MHSAKALLASAFLILSAPGMAQESKKVVERVTIDDHPFKVVWEGDQATVTRRGMFFKADARMHVAAIKAAEQVSGCIVSRDYSPGIGIVAVILDCQNRATEKN
jgi:hypothetical protein